MSFIFLLAACGGGGGSTAATGTTADSGSLSLSLIDAATADFKAVYVTIDEVEVHDNQGNGWQTVATPGATYNLLELVNGVMENLGVADLPAGDYTQMRLLLGSTPDDGTNILGDVHPFANYVIDTADQAHELKVPSGFQSGIKLVHAFVITEGETTELILDFDAQKSVIRPGNSGKWLLKPTIGIQHVARHATVSGTVNESGGGPIEGALVTAQESDTTAADDKGRVTVAAGTVSDENGSSSLYVCAGSYTMVAVKEGYEPACAAVSLEQTESVTEDFYLDAATTGTLKGQAAIAGGTAEETVTISVRQERSCSGAATEIEVASVQVANGGSYQLTLPIGDYTVVAWAEGETTQSHTAVTIAESSDTTLDIAF